MDGFIEANKLLVGGMCLISLVSTVSVFRAVAELERTRPHVLVRVGIKRFDLGLRCYKGLALLAFSRRGAELTPMQRLPFRLLFITYASFLALGIYLLGRPS